MIRITELRLPLDHEPAALRAAVLLRLGVAETYDVIVTPEADSAYCLFAQTIDRTGFARGTLSTSPGREAPVPAMDMAPILSHRDMGMAGMDHSGHDMSAMAGMDHSGHDMSAMEGMDHSGHDMSAMAVDPNLSKPLAKAGFGSNFDADGSIVHPSTEFGPQVDMRPMAPPSGLADPGIGLRSHQQQLGRRVLTYADLRSLQPTRDKREPAREIELHLTGNMQRYMWSFNGQRFADAEPLRLSYGERLRIILVNDTMMTHPVHLHGMWSELETGDPDYMPRKHTVLVQPGSKISYLLTADAKGDWAFHCHLLYHMLGMMRRVRVL
jgi:CopA family copper-resistance protein